jgi:hypothetical protein
VVAWFRHDIPAWMDGTEGLDDGPYRAYHVICQLIYLNEGPIALNEHGIAGRCKQSIRTFRTSLKALLDLGKLTLSEGRLDNSRAKKELENISDNRVNAGKGGVKSGEVRKSRSKALENKEPEQASLQIDGSQKRREEKTREDNKAPAVAAPKNPEADLFRRVKEIVGPDKGGMMAKKLLASKDGNVALARAAAEQASQKQDGEEFLWAVIRNRGSPANDPAAGRAF